MSAVHLSFAAIGPYPHRIRLRGPWEYQPLAATSSPELPPGKMVVPCRWNADGLTNFAGTVRFRRRFSFPARLESQERAWLTFAGVEDSATLWLNDQPLPAIEAGAHTGEFEVTQLLQLRNLLQVDVTIAGRHGGLVGEVALEIRCLAYLRRLSAQLFPVPHGFRLQVEGEVVGPNKLPLELYVLAERHTVAYAPITAAEEGQPFQLLSEELARESHDFTIDLVRGGSSWYTVGAKLDS